MQVCGLAASDSGQFSQAIALTPEVREIAQRKMSQHCYASPLWTTRSPALPACRGSAPQTQNPLSGRRLPAPPSLETRPGIPGTERSGRGCRRRGPLCSPGTAGPHIPEGKSCTCDSNQSRLRHVLAGPLGPSFCKVDLVPGHPYRHSIVTAGRLTQEFCMQPRRSCFSPNTEHTPS